MANSSAIIEYKNLIVKKLIGNKDFIAAMGNPDINESDEAVYKYIFPYFYIPGTIESAHSYICIKVDMLSTAGDTELLGEFRVRIWAIVHQDIMKMNGVGGATRMDYLAQLVDKMFNGSEAFGVGKLRLTSNLEDDLDMVHRCRELTFLTKDVNDGTVCAV